MTEEERNNLIELARQFRKDGKCNDAIDTYRRILDHNPDDEVIYSLLLCLKHEGLTGLLLDEYRKMIRRSPSDLRILGNYAVALEQAGQLSRAISTWNSILRRDKNLRGVNFYLARLYCKLGKVDDCLRFLKRSVEKDQDAYYSALALGIIQFSIGDYESCVASFSECIGLTVRFKDAFLPSETYEKPVCIALSLYAIGKLCADEASESYCKRIIECSLEIFPSCVGLFDELVTCKYFLCPD